MLIREHLPVIHLLVSRPTGPYGEPIPSVLQLAA